MTELVRKYSLTLLILLLLCAVWEASVRILSVPGYILPPPSSILLTFLYRFPTFVWHAATTTLEIALGMVIGGSGGILLALLIFYLPSVGRSIYPLILASQMIPVFAIAPLLIVWFGYGLWSKAIVSALIVFFPIVINSVDGLRSVNPETIDLLSSMRASRWQAFRFVRVPASLPSFFSGLKIAVTLSVVGATISEWLGAKRGLGYLMIQSNALMRIDVVFASILALTIIGLLLFTLVRTIEHRILRWQVRR